MSEDTHQKVVIVDFQMRFGSIVWLMVKCAIAAIPAMIILAVIGAFISGFLTALFGHH